MKKVVLSICLLCMTVAAKAQFEQGKWIVNPSTTGLNLSNSDVAGTQFGLSAHVGAFIVDNTALMVGLGAEWTDPVDHYYASVGGRYYCNWGGVYFGAGMKLHHWNIGSSTTNVSTYGEVGYAFFLSRTVTIEPAVYYDLSLKHRDFSELGFRLGFGFYF